MTPDEVRRQVNEIVARGNGDPEGSHFDEDTLLASVLRAIANGAPDAADLAREALRLADNQELTRWYA